jgi:hypothetical protein
MANSHSKGRKKSNSNSSILERFLRSDKQLPVLTAIAAGLYPVFFYYNNNYNLVNTWQHLVYFVCMFLLLPVVIFWVANRFSNLAFMARWKKYVLPFLNIFVFLFLLKVCLYAGLQKKMILGILVIAGLFAWFLHKQLKKIIVLQFVLAAVVLFNLVPTIIKQFNYSQEWAKQPDSIENTMFKQKPNVYFIQPDGYVNFSEIDKGYYKIDNDAFREFLVDNGFTNYDGFRNNYASTLSSNSATFMMKHHYYNKGTSFSESINARNVIISDNAVLNIFKNNAYTTHFISEKPYLIMNRPKVGYDKMNFDYSEVPYISTGLIDRKEILPALKEYMAAGQGPKFYFMEFFNPGHIHSRKSGSEGKEREKEKWMESLKEANRKLTELITAIKSEDANALIIIMGDHGGFVGMDYTEQIYEKTTDRDLIYSIFSSQLSIHWPGERPVSYDSRLDSAVNLFRVLFSYLSEAPQFLNNLQPDESYVVLRQDAPKGIYKYIADDGSVVFEQH